MKKKESNRHSRKSGHQLQKGARHQDELAEFEFEFEL
jgi:hypothetical protein